jgi:small ligand-binding sensory domain FIST
MDTVAEEKKPGEGYYEEKKRYVRNFKKAALLLIHAASKHFEKKLVQEQEVMNNLANILMDIYVAESACLRVEKMERMKGPEAAAIYRDIIDVYVFDAAARIRKAGLDAIYSFAVNDMATNLSKTIDQLTTVAGVNAKEARRRIADKLIADNQYRF